MIFLDFETTGLDHRKHRIVEYAAVRYEPGVTKHAAIASLIKQDRKLPAKIVEITGITDDMIAADGEEPKEAMEQLVDFIGPLPVVAYNCDFDLGFLNAACEEYDLKPKRKGHSCALKLVRRAFPNLPNHRLTTVAEAMGFPVDQAHRAFADAGLAAKVYLTTSKILMDAAPSA